MQVPEQTVREKILILGAAGRDFHNFQCHFKDNEKYEVVAFTATQIPGIDARRYPTSLAGKLYPEGIAIVPETKMEELIAEHGVQRCILAYSDLHNQTVMELSQRVNAAGADFTIMGTKRTMIQSTKPVIAITAVRTGVGKSQISRYVAGLIKAAGLTPVAIRHPMPYGDLGDPEQAVQRFACYEDCDKYKITIEEREEYEMHIEAGIVVYAGIDYEGIVRAAEKEADVIIWDGGNNDYPFYVPDFWMILADPLRAGHERTYYPGAAGFRAADVIVVCKTNSATAEQIKTITDSAAELNPKAKVIQVESDIRTDQPELIKGKRVVLVDDGPTLTHGEMASGAGEVAALKYGAKEIIDPRPFAVGSLKAVLDKWAHLGNTLPAMGYYPEQIADLENSINASGADAVVVATPMDLEKLIKIKLPIAKVIYRHADKPTGAKLMDVVNPFLASIKK